MEKQKIQTVNGQTFEQFLTEHPYKPTRSFTKEEWESSMYEKWKDQPQKDMFTAGEWAVGYGDSSNALGIFRKEMLDSGKMESPICLISPVDKVTETDKANAALIAEAPAMYKENKKLKSKNRTLSNNVLELKEALSQLLDRLSYHGSIDPIREEGPIEDAKTILNRIK